MNDTSGAWASNLDRNALIQRAKYLQQIRQFFAERDVVEVETPLLASSAVSDPQIESMQCQSPEQRWLRTSPEYFHKRLLASGSGDIFELGKVFRAGEAGRWHNPEFTMLEWYRVDWDYHQLMAEVEGLVRTLLASQSGQWHTEKISYRDLHQQILNIDPFSLSHKEWIHLAQQHGLRDADTENIVTLQDFIYGVAIRKHLPNNQLSFVYDFPVHQAALARIRTGHPDVAERFELFMGDIEIANGYQELTDSLEQAQRFEHDQKIRQEHQQVTRPLDQYFLQAMQQGLPRCSGVAMGIDRLLSKLISTNELSNVLSFHWQNS